MKPLLTQGRASPHVWSSTEICTSVASCHGSTISWEDVSWKTKKSGNCNSVYHLLYDYSCPPWVYWIDDNYLAELWCLSKTVQWYFGTLCSLAQQNFVSKYSSVLWSNCTGPSPHWLLQAVAIHTLGGDWWYLGVIYTNAWKILVGNHLVLPNENGSPLPQRSPLCESRKEFLLLRVVKEEGREEWRFSSSGAWTDSFLLARGEGRPEKNFRNEGN